MRAPRSTAARLRTGHESGVVRRPAVAVASLAAAASLAAGGCSGGSSSSSSSRPGTASCPSPASAGVATAGAATPAGAGAGTDTSSGAATSSGAGPGSGRPGSPGGWTLPDGNPESTRDVASAITSSNVSRLGVAWTVPIPAGGGYVATPVVVNGVVYTQDQHSDVMAIRLATGKVLWTHTYNSLDGGPNGVTVEGGRVYAATATSAVALSAATGRQLWSRTLTRSVHEEIDMAPGYHDGTVYLSTAPVSSHDEYAGGAKAVLWALSASTGAPEWSWDEVQDLWGKPGINSGGGQWYPPSFDVQGNLYLGVANPGPLGGTRGYPWGTSRPGPDLYTDSVVKLSPRGRLLWYYQLTPHDLFDWDLQDPPMLTTANGRPVVIDGGKAGIVVELDARTGRPIWKVPVGMHNGHDHDGLLTEYAGPGSHLALPASFCLEPGAFGGIESQLASNGSMTFAAVNDLPMTITSTGGFTVVGGLAGLTAALAAAPGEMVAVNQDTGRIAWDAKLPSSPYGAATVTNDLVFTTTYHGDLYAFSTATGAIAAKKPMSAGSNAPVAIDGDYVIAGAAGPLSAGQQALIIAYKLGARGTLPGAAAP